MLRCLHCGNVCNRDGGCAHCDDRPAEFHASDNLEAETDAGWTVIARFANAAEAGYFANELEYVLGFEPRLDCRDDFDAIHHYWRSGFVLSVPEPLADRARTALRQALDSESEERPAQDGVPAAAVPVLFPRRFVDQHAARSNGSAIKWGPLFLTLAAGSLVIWHGKKPPLHRAPAQPDRAERIPLREVPGLHDAGWVQDRGGVRRELIFAAPGADGTLREDRDGDGVYERQFTVRVGD